MGCRKVQLRAFPIPLNLSGFMPGLIYFQKKFGLRAAVEALCCKEFRYSLIGRTLIWYENFAWGSRHGVLYKSSEQESPIQDGIHEWSDSYNEWARLFCPQCYVLLEPALSSYTSWDWGEKHGSLVEDPRVIFTSFC